MKILYFDCYAGVSGDMLLGAFCDLGVPAAHIEQALAGLPLKDSFALSFNEVTRGGIRGVKAEVTVTGKDLPQRYIGDIESILRDSTLSMEVQKRAMEIFRLIAVAEGRVHGIDPARVHFHEVGAIDSIVDIVGAAVCLEYIGADRVISGPVELGAGTVKTAHGLLPVPAPATSELLKGFPVTMGRVPYEAATPTGAAVIAAVATAAAAVPPMKIEATGYGAGSRDGDVPNMLRLILGESLDTSSDTVIESRWTLDDMTGEELGHAMERFMEEGALDVYSAPVLMKKGRPGHEMVLLYREEDEERFRRMIFTETSTLGFRTARIGRATLERHSRNVATSLGDVTIKQGLLEGEVIKEKPEYEDCRRIALEKGLPLSEVYRIVRKETSHDT